MPTFLNDGRTAALFLFNHIITRFGIPHAIVTDHGAHFKNQMMSELHIKLGFRHENSSPYYPQENGQVEAINKVLKTMIQRMVGENKISWHLQLFSHSLGLSHVCENLNRIHSFPVGLWH
jgi:transposase InsO family protein